MTVSHWKQLGWNYNFVKLSQIHYNTKQRGKNVSIEEIKWIIWECYSVFILKVDRDQYCLIVNLEKCKKRLLPTLGKLEMYFGWGKREVGWSSDRMNSWLTLLEVR